MPRVFPFRNPERRKDPVTALEPNHAWAGTLGLLNTLENSSVPPSPLAMSSARKQLEHLSQFFPAPALVARDGERGVLFQWRHGMRVRVTEAGAVMKWR